MLSDMLAGRALSTEATLNSQVIPTLRPFLSRFEKWNQRAAYLTGVLLSRTVTPEELERRFSDLEELAAEVDGSFAEFEEAVGPLPYHSRVEDLRAAFRRLQALLRNAGASAHD